MIKEIDEEDHRMVGSTIMKYKRVIYIYIYIYIFFFFAKCEFH
jgi:hypothetical protein